MLSDFSKYLAKVNETDKDFIDEFVSRCSYKTLQKGSFILKQGEYSKYIYWVSSGLLIKYVIDESGKKHVIQFAPDNWWMAERESMYFGKPSKHFIQCLEDTTVVYYNEELILDLHKKYPAFNKYHFRLLQNHIRHLNNRILMLLSASAKERYLAFLELYPNLFSHLSMGDIASYLGITSECLSRVRKEISENKNNFLT